MLEDNTNTPSLSRGLSNHSLDRNRTVSTEKAPNNNLLDSTHTKLLLANEVKEIKEIEKHFVLLPDSQPISHNPI